MQVTTKITVDLTRPNIGGRVNAVQGDGNTRQVKITLLAGGVPWTPPDGMEAAIAYYTQPSGTKGMYNLLADGTAAISITGNVATIVLAPQMLTASGTVQAYLVFNDSQLNRLTTFPFSVSVTSNPAAGAQKTEDYIRLQWLEDKLDEYLRKAADSGEFDGAPGPVGATPNIQIGTVETLEAGSSATASMTGTPENPLLNLGIPQGAPGSGGSGIAVSGATVGQTVRIAAVDENGKPTAFEPVDFPKGGHWETIYEYVSDNIVVTDFSITYDKENKYSILTVPDGVLSEFNVGDNVFLAIFPLDGTSEYSASYITGSQYNIKKNSATILSDVEIRIQNNSDMSDITTSNAVIEIMHGDIPKIFGDTIAFNPTSKIRYTGINTGGDISGYTFSLFYNLRYMGNRTEGYLQMKTKHMNLIANLEVANGLLLFHHTLSVNMLSSMSAYHNKWTDREVVGHIDAPTSYMTDGKLTSIKLGEFQGTPMFPRKGGFIRIEGWYE